MSWRAAVVVLCLWAGAPASAQTESAAADSDTTVAPVFTMPPTRYGIVRADLPDDPGANQVAVTRAHYRANFGTRDGVRPGSIFQVYRDPQRYIGLLRVERTWRDSSSLAMVLLDRKYDADAATPVQRGDLLYPYYVLLESVNFGTGKPDFSADMHKRLRYAARFILNNPDFPVILEGHTDNTGRRADNVTLAVERANVVRDYLQDIQRVPRERLFAAGYADEQPIASNRSEEGRRLNRRVDVVLVYELPPEAIDAMESP